MKQIYRTSMIIVLGNLQLSPCILMFSSTIIACVFGITYTCALVYFWGSTKMGRRFFRSFYLSTLRLEKFLFGNISGC